MKVAVFGGTGFVGSYLIESLEKNNYDVITLVRPNSKDKLDNSNAKIVYGCIKDKESIKKTIQSCDIVIYNIGIIREFKHLGISFEDLHFKAAKECIDIAKVEKVKQFILMSANGVKKNGTSYQKTKFLAEEYLKKSDLAYTIFRPSLIFGDPRSSNRPEFCTQLKKDMLSLPIPAPLFFKGMNLFDAGNFAMSPIHVKDVAKIFVNSILNQKMFYQSYNIGGEKYNWKEIIKIISSACGREKWMIPAPIAPIKFISYRYQLLSKW